MRGQHDRAGQPAQVPFEELHRGVVEMVGGLVEQQRFRLADQQRGQAEPRPLPAGERAQPPRRCDAAQSEPGEHELGAAIGVPQVVGLRPFQGPPVLGERRLVADDALGEFVQPPGRGADVGERVVDHIGHRRCVGER